ncbi:VCBS repeat-containing protein [Polyangium sp. 15x6]|uniref:FG-GAP repeat domain-containing protein n=1 Tax=Polyangium sp. 15x6 TaxID=3042687 RepID=UPI002499B06D|nr:VCBS repeat-containing protein [Polyangium sp. 15x6]MDI3283821.1 VCBS repeat-containing protein [Polyangium sp. 15x6]
MRAIEFHQTRIIPALLLSLVTACGSAVPDDLADMTSSEGLSTDPNGALGFETTSHETSNNGFCTPATVGICAHTTTGAGCSASDGVSAFGPFLGGASVFAQPEWSNGSKWATIEFADVSGDGRDDVCGRGASGISCALGSATGFGTATIWGSQWTDANLWGSADNIWATLRFVDITGDGKADVCARALGGIACAVSNGSGFGALSLWSTDYSNARQWHTDPSRWGTIQYPDVDGDGRADVCGRDTTGIRCAISNGSTQFGWNLLWSTEFGNNSSWTDHVDFWATIQFPDVNGDGRADVCGRLTDGIKCALSTGLGFGALSSWSGDFTDTGEWYTTPSRWGTIQFPDLNGDGMADVCGRSSSGVRCGLSDGTKFAGTSQWDTMYSDANQWHHDYHANTIQFPDVNADGKADLCGRSSLGIQCSLSSGWSFNAPTLWTVNLFSNAWGWTANQYWGTIDFPRLTAGTCWPINDRTPRLRLIQRFGYPFNL